MSEKFRQDQGSVPQTLEDHLNWSKQLDEEESVQFAPLSSEQKALYDKAMKAPAETVVTQPSVDEMYGLTLSKEDIVRMQDGQWLNDECVNLYMKMIQKRADERKDNIHCFNSFFYELLTQQGYHKVQRWTRRFDLFAKDMVLIPVHLGNHWCMGVINFKKRRFEYYDSLRGNNKEFFQAMRDYLEKESMDKKKKSFDFSDWNSDVINDKDLPLQRNGSDCGVFASMFGESLSQGKFPRFHQSDMPLIRERMTVELLTGKFLQ